MTIQPSPRSETGPAPRAEGGRPILEVRDIRKSFGGVEAVGGVSFTLAPGEVVALAGDNGAGKSTVIKMISGVYVPDAGEILLEGQPIQGLEPRAIRDRGIETIYQDLALADNLDVGINLFLGRERTKRVLGLLPVVDRATMRREAQEELRRLGIQLPSPLSPVRNFSGGQRQAIAIARAVYWSRRRPSACLSSARSAR